MIADVLALTVGHGAPIRFTAYDGSGAGPDDADVRIHIASHDALRYAVTAPGELGLARAFVAGTIEIEGDLHTALGLLTDGATRMGELSVRARVQLLRDLGLRAGASLVKPISPPAQEVPPAWERALHAGLRHARGRDAEAIHHHYDVSNAFYELVLGPSMVYTCAVYPSLDATLEQAQAEKLDLVCRKLGLGPGSRLLDVGCGWGSLSLHAARTYGAHALAVTLSVEQAAYARERVRAEGLEHLVEVRHSDYRDVTGTDFDAIASIGMTEHIGLGQLPSYVGHLRARLRPGGRLLNHCITRSESRTPSIIKRGFIARYVFPDGELPAPSRVMQALTDGGFEVRHGENLREHYALTLRDWCENLSKHRDAAVTEVGEAVVRIWALYMAGSRLAFDRDQVQLHQFLAVRPHDDGRSGMPLRQDWRP